jgi:quinol monooxygenase YgiN
MGTNGENLLHIVWEFVAKPDHVAEFERIYGSDGEWSRLFRKSSHYRETILTRDTDRRGRYLLTDIWDDHDSFVSFKKQFREEYERLDRECEALTEQETRIGEFEKI